MKKIAEGLHGIHTGTPQGRRSELGPREGAAQDQSADRPAGGARASRDRPQGALYRREGLVLRRHDAGGEPAADRLSGDVTRRGRSSSIATSGSRTTSSCGTIAAPCTSRSATTRKARSATSSAPPSRAHRRDITCNEAFFLPAGRRRPRTRSLLAPAIVRAQGTYPDKQIRMVIPFAAGRHDRPDGARRRPAFRAGLGPARGGRQPCRRQRRRRGRDRRQGSRRRLHAQRRGDGPCHQSADLQEAAL